MTEEERSRWNVRHRREAREEAGRPAAILLDSVRWHPPPGVALDLAAGAGRNSLWLADRGHRVLAVDVSGEGLRRLARRECRRAGRRGARAARVQPIQADLELFHVREAAFDIVVNTHFLLRSTFRLIRRCLRPGGLLLFETFSVHEIDELGGDIRRQYALERGELREAFADFELLLYEEGVFDREEGQRGLARLVARRPTPGPYPRSASLASSMSRDDPESPIRSS